MPEERRISPAVVIIPLGLILAAAVAILALPRAAPEEPPEPPPGLANLYGKVTDAQTGSAIPGVKVTLNGLITYTDSIGRYAFEGLAVGSYVITFEKEGYQPLV